MWRKSQGSFLEGQTFGDAWRVGDAWRFLTLNTRQLAFIEHFRGAAEFPRRLCVGRGEGGTNSTPASYMNKSGLGDEGGFRATGWRAFWIWTLPHRSSGRGGVLSRPPTPTPQGCVGQAKPRLALLCALLPCTCPFVFFSLLSHTRRKSHRLRGQRRRRSFACLLPSGGL